MGNRLPLAMSVKLESSVSVMLFVIASPVEIQRDARIFALPRVSIRRRRRAVRCAAALAPGFVPQLARPSTAGVRRDAGRADVIPEQVADRAGLAHGHARPAGFIIPYAGGCALLDDVRNGNLVELRYGAVPSPGARQASSF